MSLETKIFDDDGNESVLETIKQIVIDKTSTTIKKDYILKSSTRIDDKDLNLDSLDVFEVQMELADKYNIDFPKDYEPKTFGEIADYIITNKK